MTGSLVCEPAKLDWSAASGPRAADYDDVYFSAEDGLEETRAVFLKACHLPEAWQGRRHFTVGELGFGTGLNALALWQLWRETRPAGAWLDFVSIEKHPLSPEEARRAFAQWPSLSELSERLLAQWPPRLKGAHRLVFPEDGFAITLFHDEAEAALAQIEARMDAWFLDGFAPARNDAMWSQPVLYAIGRLSNPGARVGTFTVAGFVRRGLAEAGFSVSKQPGFGRKRERLEAIFPGEASPEKPAPGRIAIIGAGIAGAALAHALSMRGCEPVLIDKAGLAGGASGAPAGLLTPRMERADRPHVRATLAAFDFARRLYAGLDEYEACGVIRQPKDEAEAARFAGIADLMDDSVVWRDRALDLTNSGRFKPAHLVTQLAGNAPLIKADIAQVGTGADGVSLRDGEGRSVLEADLVIHASGAGAGMVLPDISPSAGQVAVFKGQAPARPVTWGHYVCAAPQGVLVGATHVRGEDAGPSGPAIESFREACGVHCPELELGDVVETWSGVRASTPDRLPVAGALDARTFILSGLGSRGFAHAPLLAEQLASLICGQAAALEKAGLEVLEPGRFEMRRRRREG